MPNVGFRFRPTEEELVGYFLYNKITENPVLDDDDDDPVKVCDLYGDQEPWDIWQFCGGNDLLKDEALYFFTQLKKVSPKGSRYNRKIASGAWQGEDGAKSVMACDSDTILGFKKRFRYENSNNSEQNGGWIMYEYTFNSSLLGEQYSHKAMDYVLCCVKKKESVQHQEKASLVKKQRKLKQVDEKNEPGQGVQGRKRKLKQEATPSDPNQNKCLKTEQEAKLLQPRELPCDNYVLEVVGSEAETEICSDPFDFKDLFSDIYPSLEAESCSLAFNVAELCSLLDQGEEVNCMECPITVDESVQSQPLKDEEEAVAQVVQCEARKNPLHEDEYEGFYSNKLDQILGRVLLNVEEQNLNQWAF